MKFFSRQSICETGADPILVFGDGLVGKQIVRALTGESTFKYEDIPYLWSLSLFSRQAQESRIESILADRLASCRSFGTILSIVWSAGKAGFESDDSDIELELSEFKSIFAMINRICQKLSYMQIKVFFISSAGALFEGQRQIHSDSIPLPRRPYGHLKLAQESFLSSLESVSVYIYRLSSVYGAYASRDRKNLISALLRAAHKREIFKVSGNLSTLRDFINSEDVGIFVAKEILKTVPYATNKPLCLASSKPSSIFEIRKIIEDMLMRKIYISFDPKPTNALDITYSPSLIPSVIWNPIDIRTGVRRLYSLMHLNGIS